MAIYNPFGRSFAVSWDYCHNVFVGFDGDSDADFDLDNPLKFLLTIFDNIS